MLPQCQGMVQTLPEVSVLMVYCRVVYQLYLFIPRNGQNGRASLDRGFVPTTPSHLSKVLLSLELRSRRGGMRCSQIFASPKR